MKDQDKSNLEDKGHQIVVTEKTNAQPPIDFTGLRLGKMKANSAGIPSILSSLSQANKYMSTGTAIKTMFRMNQKGGFDCPGCAWPDPDDDRSSLGTTYRLF